MTVQEPSVRPSLIGTWFPTRYLYLRDGDSVRAWALTPVKQALGAVAAVLLGSWTVLASGSMIFDMVAQSRADRTVASARAASERMNADLQARRMGVEGVPFFIFNRRYAVSGAQEAQALVEAMIASQAPGDEPPAQGA